MVENRIHNEQASGQAGEKKSFPGAEDPRKGKVTDALRGARDFFSRLWNSADAKPGAAPGVKVSAVSLSAVLSAHKLDLKSVNQALALALAGLVALTLYFAFSDKPQISSVTAAVSKINFQNLENKTVEPFQELAFYLAQVKQRDIFNQYEEPKPPPPVVKPAPPPPPPPPPPRVMIQEKAKNLKLMGISWGSEPKAMIRNETTQEVYFLEEGHKIKGTDIDVRKIQKDAVVIGSGEDEMRML